MTFRSALSRFEKERILIEAASGSWSLNDLMKVDRKRVAQLSGARIAVHIADPALGLRILLALDGVARSILIASTSLSQSHLERLLALSRCEYLFTDRATRAEYPHSLVVLDEIDDLPPTTGINHCGVLETEWHLATSGTTGAPKLVSHSFASLTRTTKLGSYLPGLDRWGLLYDYTRFAGMQVVLQAMLSGGQLISPPLNATVRERVRHLVDNGCTHLSATPTMWRSIAMTPEAQNLPLRQVTLGGEIADDRILATLSALYPGSRVVHIYASTEAGVGFSVKDGRAGFPAAYLSEFSGSIALRVQHARLHIRNTRDISSYVGSQESFEADNGWIDTGDSVALVGDRVYFQGRASGQVNVGGNKFFVEEVEAVLLSHPAVHQARVYARPSSLVGALISAQVVIQDSAMDSKQLCRELKAFAADQLQSHMVPAIIEVVDEVPLLSSGKVER